MACVPIPQLPLPELPSPLTLVPPDPGLTFDPTLCCKLLSYPIATPPINLPPGTVNLGTVQVLTNALSSIQTYLDSLPLSCPRE